MVTACPNESELLLFATGEVLAEPDKSRIAAHVAECARCRTAVAGFRALAAAVRRTTRHAEDSVARHLDELAIATFAEGGATGDARAAAIAHFVTCTSCRAQLAELCAALKDDAIVAELGFVTPRPSTFQWSAGSRRGLIGGLAAAALVIAVVGTRVLNNNATTDGTAALRDESGAMSVAPTIIAPVTIAADTSAFRWSRVPGADRYRVSVFSADGVVVWETQTGDTIAAAPSPSPLRRGERYLWKVEARTDFDRWVSSRLAEFQVAGAGGRK
jgi:hypothetical protein